jgi:hypothetical protein
VTDVLGYIEAGIRRSEREEEVLVSPDFSSLFFKVIFRDLCIIT